MQQQVSQMQDEHADGTYEGGLAPAPRPRSNSAYYDYVLEVMLSGMHDNDLCSDGDDDDDDDNCSSDRTNASKDESHHNEDSADDDDDAARGVKRPRRTTD
jgi:hypothetical protein